MTVRGGSRLALAVLHISCSATLVAAQAESKSMYGADALYTVTRAAVASCVAQGRLAANNTFYVGSGSDEGGWAMGARGSFGASAATQQVAPQSRFLSREECDVFGPNQGNGITIGLDGISVVAATGNGCDVLKYAGSSNGYAFTDWREVLRIVYTGQLSKLPGVTEPTDGCSLAEPPTTPSEPGDITDAKLNGIEDTRGVANNASTTTRCDNPVRRALIAQWPRMFQDACTNGTCGPLRHAWRPDDSSGTTQTFLALLGLPTMNRNAAVRTFCNGLDTEDLDPLRTACDANEQVCSSIPYANRNANPNGRAPQTGQAATDPPTRGGDLGLVQAITMPVDVSMQFGVQPCTFGKFAYAPMPPAASLESQRCPDGGHRTGGRCKYPYYGNTPPIQSLSSSFNCLAAPGTVPSPREWVNMDGRAYNLIPRDPTTGSILIKSSAPGVADPRWGGGGVYRLHQSKAMANSAIAAGFTGCTSQSATQQIGCLVAADPCSLGFAGLEALKQPQTRALSLRSPSNTPAVAVGPSEANILKLLDACPSVGTRYPLARKLWVNSAKGLGAVVNAPQPGVNDKNEADFMSCIGNRSNGILDAAITASNYVKLPASYLDYPLDICR